MNLVEVQIATYIRKMEFHKEKAFIAEMKLGS